MLRGWHKLKVGYGPAESAIFQTTDLARVQKGGRRLLPSKKLERSAHPTSAFPKMRSGPIATALELFSDLPNRERNSHIIRDILDKHDAWDDLVYEALAESLCCGLMRFSEAVNPKMTRADIQFKFSTNSEGDALRLIESTLWCTPLKKNTEEKVPMHWGPGLGTEMAAGELILLMLACDPIPDSEIPTTPLFRLRRQHGDRTINRETFQAWYQRRMAACGYTETSQYKTHSFRIGGATKLAFKGVSPLQIQIMGRWASDIYKIYCRRCKGKMISIHQILTSGTDDPDRVESDDWWDSFAAAEAVDIDDDDDE